MIRRAVGVLQAVGVNSVPALGFFVADWSLGTALALYWCENVLGILLVGARIGLHRSKTRKKGHWLARVETVGPAKPARKPSGRKQRGRKPAAGRHLTFLQSFLSTALVFTAAHGLFLALILTLLLPAEGVEAAAVDASVLGRGLAAIGLLLLLGYAADLPGLARQPFAWVKTLSDRMMGRVVVVHLTIVLGMGAMAFIGAPQALFAVFVALKTLVDLGTWMPGRERTALDLSEEPPRWLAAMTRNLKGHGTDEDLATFWKRTRREEIERRKLYEEVQPARGST